MYLYLYMNEGSTMSGTTVTAQSDGCSLLPISAYGSDDKTTSSASPSIRGKNGGSYTTQSTPSSPATSTVTPFFSVIDDQFLHNRRGTKNLERIEKPAALPVLQPCFD